MTLNNDKKALVQNAKAFCSHLLRSRLPPYLVYHNYQHTYAVAKAAHEIGHNSGLPEGELQIVAVAAWFHDTGYSEKYKGHEDVSKLLAAAFLQDQGVDKNFQARVAACIEATRQPQNPQTLLEQVLCDADLSHLGKQTFPVSSQKLKKEMELMKGILIPEQEWHRQNIFFLESHTFFTPYAKDIYSRQQYKNILRERKLLLH